MFNDVEDQSDFDEDLVTALFEDIDSYDAEVVTVPELINDHRLTHAWAPKAARGSFKHTFKQVQILHDQITKVMLRHGINHNTPLTGSSVKLFDDSRTTSTMDMNVIKKGFNDYNPSDLSDEDLIEDHAMIHLGATLQKMNPKKFPVPIMVAAHSKIVAVLLDRGFQHMTPLAEGFGRVEPSGEIAGPMITLQEVLNHFEDFRVSSPIAYVVGGLANHGETEGDIDILINYPAPKKGEFDHAMALKFRILRMLPKELWHRIQFLYDDSHGPFTNHVPLYDLVAMRRPAELVEMSETDPPPLTAGDGPVDCGLSSSGLQDEARPLQSIFFGSKLRIKKEVIKKMAVNSKEEDRIKPFRFFFMLKARRKGYRKSEEYSIAGVIDSLKDTDYPVMTDPKYDGFHLQIHKEGDRVKMWTEDGGEVTRFFPTLVEQLKKIKISFVVASEMELWVPRGSKYVTKGRSFVKGRQHLGRADVSGYIHQKEPDEKEKFAIANAFDIVYFNGEDIHNEPLADRVKILHKLPDTGMFKKSDYRIAKTPKQLGRDMEFFSKKPNSEGAMIKPMGRKYPLTGIGGFIKYKIEFDLDAQVVDRVKKKGGQKAWVYFMAIKNQKGELVPVGKTFATGIDVPKGDILRVSFATISRYTDPSGKVWYNWWAPRPMEYRREMDKPDTTTTADKLVKVTNGEIADKSVPKHFQNLGLQADPFLQYPDESKVHQFVIQHHHRGASVHKDIRMQLEDFLVGWTLADQVKGKVPDVNTVKDARAVNKNWDSPRWFKFQPKFIGKHVFTARKAPEPMEWLKVTGVVEPGGVGATRFEHGVFQIIDKGIVEYGTQKPQFHEYFLHGQKFNGRFVVRLLPKEERYRKVGRQSLFWESWMAKDQIPYVIGNRARREGWIPPQGISALPRKMRIAIPKKYQYWHSKSKRERIETRDALIQAIKKDHVKLAGVSFTLTRKTQQGPKVVRAGPSVEEWELMINTRKTGLDYFVMDQNPLSNTKVAGLRKPRDDKQWLDFEGEIQHGKPGFPQGVSEKIRVDVDIIDKGTAVILENNIEFMKVDFRGKRLKGSWTIEREESSKIWIMKRTAAPQTLAFSAPWELTNTPLRTPEGLLIKDVCLLGVGAWKGGGMEHAVWHSPGYNKQVLDLMKGKKTPLCAEHACFPDGNFDPKLSYGYILNERIENDGDLYGDVMVTDPKAIDLVESKHFKGVSINVDAFVCPDRRYAINPARVKEASLVTNPACKVCWIPGCET